MAATRAGAVQSSVAIRELGGKFPDVLDKTKALELALQAAELYLGLSRLVRGKEEKSNLRRQAERLIGAAELIKRAQADLKIQQSRLLGNGYSEDLTALSDLLSKSTLGETAPAVPPSTAFSHSPKFLSVPKSSRVLSDKEQQILSRGSLLNDCYFPEWMSSALPPGATVGKDGVFNDDTELRLSPQHHSLSARWERPEVAFRALKNHPAAQETIAQDAFVPTMQPSHPCDFVQDAGTDCSIVASLCACRGWTERGHGEMLSTILFPSKTIAESGRYTVCLNFNGCLREVAIDDRLPVSDSSRLLHVFDAHNPTLLWPALLEKAFLKVHGGYDFSGSNSGTDIWMIASWIPEQIILQGDADIDKLWTKLLRSFHYGDVLISLGTGKMTTSAEADTGLVSEHDYAVMDLKGDGEVRSLLVKNPWLEGTSLRNCHYQHHTDPITQKFSAGQSVEGSTNISAANSLDRSKKGTFQMSFFDVVQNFHSLYLNWNPGLFTHREDIHFSWDLSSTSVDSRSPPGSFNNNPQFAVSCNDNAMLWILVCKHLQDTKPKAVATEKIISEGYISLYSFTNDGNRVYLSRGADVQSKYVDSPHTLIKLETMKSQKHTIVISQQDLPASQHRFTLSAFATAPISITAASFGMPFRKVIKSSWAVGSAAGNSNLANYFENPQFCLDVTATTGICAFLETAAANANVNVKILHGNGSRMYKFTTRDIVSDSGEYRPGCAIAAPAQLVTAGKYTIICSTFDPDQFCDFNLTIDSDVPVTIKSIAREGAGLIKKQIVDAIYPSSNVRALAARIRPRQLIKLNLTARWRNETGTHDARIMTADSPLRLSIVYGRGPNRKILATNESGPQNGASRSVRIQNLDLDPRLLSVDDIWLVVERSGAEIRSRDDDCVLVDLWIDAVNGLEVSKWEEWY